MIVTIQPSTLSGNIYAPASKSSMQRACAAALVRKGISVIQNPGISNDDKAALSIIKEMGCEIKINNDELVIDSTNAIIHSQLKTIDSRLSTINCGESGLSIRMFTPIVALCKNKVTINGEGSLLKRPMDFFDEILPQLNVAINSNQGKLPLQITGPLQPKNIEIDGSLSSQFLTGLLMAYSASNTDAVSISVKDLKSKPYVDLTLKVMNDFGLNVPENNNYEEFVFRKSQISNLKSQINYTVEGDWSGAAFLLVAGAIAGNIIVKGLDVQSTQADKKIIEALQDCGCTLSISDTEINVANSPLGVRGFHLNATDCPDLFPPLVALASYCKGTTVIEGVSRLVHKESNRALTLQDEFAKMGVQIELQDDLMMIKGGDTVKGARVHSRHDHRIAMACAVAALKAEGETIIEEADAINKSYPNFYEHIKLLGASVSL
ncbi:MAG: 3-phosphoshikimate 1-carboxyvinyltransferase [Bacteroidota bacterium]|nr:3-phosphoshikimate 1-carboxyvinyltransferase [Bacteroidota bacterium]